MIQSMTAFASNKHSGDWGLAIWELKTVNHRYLDISLRLPEGVRDLEMPLRASIKGKIARGKLDAVLRFTPGVSTVNLVVNQALVTQLLKQIQWLEQQTSGLAKSNAIALLNWPNVVTQEAIDLSQIKPHLLDSFQIALTSLTETRQREGDALANILTAKLAELEYVLTQLITMTPELLKLQRDKLLERFQQAQLELEPQRLEQELVLMAQKMDIAEELARLQTHINEVAAILTKGGVVGRQLDFLMQELNREANTLSAKSTDTRVTKHGVNLKVIIEQMREQVQNIE